MIARYESSPEFFEQKYAGDEDPWKFATSAREALRYQTILRSLNHRRYALCIEPGCSIGVLTERLAQHCDRVDASEFSQTAAEMARSRCSKPAQCPSIVCHFS